MFMRPDSLCLASSPGNSRHAPKSIPKRRFNNSNAPRGAAHRDAAPIDRERNPQTASGVNQGPAMFLSFEAPFHAHTLPLPSLLGNRSQVAGWPHSPLRHLVPLPSLDVLESSIRPPSDFLRSSFKASSPDARAQQPLRFFQTQLRRSSRRLSPLQRRQLSIIEQCPDALIQSTLNSSDSNRLASLRRCHRLRHPEDAFTISGAIALEASGSPVHSTKKAKPPDPLPRQRRPDRSFLPPGLIASTKASGVRWEGVEEAGDEPALPTRPAVPVDDPSTSVSVSVVEEGDGGDRRPFISLEQDEASAVSHPRAQQDPARKSGKKTNDGIVHGTTSLSSSVVVAVPASQRGAAPRDEEPLGTDPTTQNTDRDHLYEETLPEKRERIEREIMSYYGSMHRLRVDASGVIQRAWLCSRARAELHRRRQELYAFVYIRQRAAGLCIMGCLRSMVLQKRRIAEEADHAARDVARAAVERHRLASVRTLERAIHRWLTGKHEQARLCGLLNLRRDARLRAYAAAAVTIQRWWPRALARRADRQRRRAQAAVARQQAEAAARLGAAATQIQRVVRGRRGRWVVQHYRAARAEAEAARRQSLAQRTDLLLVVLREAAARQERLGVAHAHAVSRNRAAAERLQGGLQAALERRRWGLVLSHTRRLRDAAASIQRAWRRFRAGRERRYLRELQATVAQERVARERRWYEAILRLQAFARGVLAKAAMRRRRAEVGRAVLAGGKCLQRIGQGYLARRALGQRRWAEMVERTTAEAERIAYRTHAAETVQEFIRARQSGCLTEQRRRRKYLETVQLQAIVREELRREAAATSLQRAIRRHRRRQAEQKAQQEAARARAWVLRIVVQLQSWWRVCLAKRESACRRAQVAWLTRKRLELEDVRVLMEEELMEKGAQHLFYYHESGGTRDSPIAPHQNGFKEETEEINAMLDDSWAKIYEDEEIQS